MTHCDCLSHEMFVSVQIKDSKLHFRYNLNSLRTEEKDIWLSAITVDDGQWHVAKVRYVVSHYWGYSNNKNTALNSIWL